LLAFAHSITWVTCEPGMRAHWPPVDNT
jgi:hypothetical protein